MNFISVDNYVLIYNGLFDKNIVICFFVFFFIYGIVLNEFYSTKVMTFFLALLFVPLSVFFPLNGPDKGAYSIFFESLNSIGDVIYTVNTVDSPIYYFFMIFCKKIGLSVSVFFILQNLLISFCLLWFTYRYKVGYYFSFWVFFTHLIIPFSVRAHLIIVFILLVNRKSILHSLSSFALIFVHPLVALPSSLFLFRRYIFSKWFFFVGVIFLIIALSASSYFIGKFLSYTRDSSLYTDGYGLSLTFFTEILEFIVFWVILRPRDIVDRFVLLLPSFIALGSLYLPMLGRFSFSFDIVYLMVFINYAGKNKSYAFDKYRNLCILISLIAMFKFIKNYLLLGYYVL